MTAERRTDAERQPAGSGRDDHECRFVANRGAWETICGYVCAQCGNDYECQRPSRFLIRRDPDENGSYSPEEACEAHVGGSMVDLIAGSTLASVVAVAHFDGYPRPPCDSRLPLPSEMGAEDA